ncbi:MAG TPA: pitrilysin family protein [Sphingobacteriaceae bacterium]|nr:pitrilysin family protein [Sphingobacteriaceae bacterium]
MLNRILAPAFKQVKNIEFLPAKNFTLDNGIHLHVVDAGDQDLVRVEFIFNNVNWNPSKPLQAYTVNSMLTDGTSELTATQIADKIDYYGAFLQTDYTYDHSSVTLYSLTKHLKVTLPVIKAIITDSIFPQDELDTFIRNQKQSLTVNLEKNDFLSRKTFSNVLFGDSLYGFNTTAETYDKLTQKQLVEYFKNAYQLSNCTIVVSGKVTSETIKILNDLFGNDPVPISTTIENMFSFPSNSIGSEHYTEKPEALQSAIRIGRKTINRKHPDFPGLQVLNTVLGGYFGSRLMANIREDKGYTYGIGSAIVSLKNAGYFFIASEVGAEVCSKAIDEINKEVLILKTQPVPDDELVLVRNYMLGSLLGSLENAFSHADKFKNIFFYGLGYDYYERYIHTVKTISAEQIMQLANRYFNTEDFEKVIVGRK